VTRQPEPIAIVGVGLRFPGGSDSFDSFGEFLRDGRSGIRDIPEDRWDVAAFAPKSPEDRGKIQTSAGGFLDRIDQFDPTFFNISPKEAQFIDPQQRMMLETAWQALEHATIDPATLRRGNGGVYVGASSIDYALELDALSYADLDGHLAAGITMFPMSGRLSYFLGMRGPSVSIDTACSSSLVALHMAMQGLRGRECDIALCGGVNALHHPRIPVMFSHAQMLAPDGHCKTFDESADGYARAEGCGVIVLKRLSDAEADGDRILAVVRGTAVGQDGDSAGLTVPNGTAQEIVIRNALAAADLPAEAIQYVEAHGTGTPLGDPIELGAIAEVFMSSHTKEDPLLVGSVKTNLGHMEPASGLVGLIKVVSQLQAETIYPHVGMTTPSRRIPWDVYPVRIPTESEPWQAPVRRAVVNSFGFAGTIAAVVVEQPPAQQREHRTGSDGPSVLTVSAKSGAALTELLRDYRDHVAEHANGSIADLCYTSNVGRAQLPQRAAIVAGDKEALLAGIDRELNRADEPAQVTRKTAFLFSGQGAQYAGMGSSLYQRFPTFAEHVDQCDALFTPLLGESVRDLLLGTHAEPDLVNQTKFTQPVLFTLEYALAKQWMVLGVRPSVLIGHSVGEIVAATVAGLFTLEDAAKLVAARAELMQSVSAPGGMAAVSAPVEQVRPMLTGFCDLAIAAINAPDQCVVSGGTESLDKVVAMLRERDIRVDKLSVSHAFHSPLMTEVFDRFRAALAEISFQEPAIPVVSNLTGKIAKRAELSTPDYWVRHIGEPVLFMDGIRALAKRGKHTFIEVGPSTALTALAKRSLPEQEHVWVASMRRRESGVDTMIRSFAQLYTGGANLSWPALHRGRSARRVALPPYPFQRRRYWLPVNGSGGKGGAAAAGPSHNPLLGRAGQPGEFVAEISAQSPAFLADHAIDGTVTMPLAAYVEMLFAMQDAVLGHTGHEIRDLRVLEPLTLSDENAAELRTLFRHAESGQYEAEIYTGEVLHATATLVPAREPNPLPELGPVLETVSGADLYTDFASVGREYGPSFRLLDTVRVHDNGLSAVISSRAASAVEQVPVEVIDAALHAVSAASRDGVTRVPVSVESVRLFKKPRASTLELLARIDADTADLLIREGDQPVALLTGVRTQAVSGTFVHRLEWVPEAAEPAPVARARHVVAVNGSGLSAVADETETLVVSELDEVAELRKALKDPSVTDVCWCWQPLDGPMSIERVREETERNYRELLDVVAAVEAAPPSQTLRLWLSTNGAQFGDNVLAASVWGFGHVLLNEYPRYRATLVDGTAGDLVAEWLVDSADEYQVAYRDGDRHVRRILADEEPATEKLVIRPDRTYLVTGGLGGLGLVTARRLVDLGARHVALLSRRGEPSPEVREVYDELASRATITLLKGDVSEPADVTRVLGELDHPLGGVVHAAGEIGKSLIGELTWEAIDEQLRPKVYGGWLLHEATRELSTLDFFVVYSSIAGVIGGMTQAHYASASNFLDALAIWRDRQGLPGLATNWGAWAAVGMSARLDDTLSKEIERGGIRFFSPRRALHALTDLIPQPVNQRLIGEYDWDRVAAAAPHRNALYREVATGSAAEESSVDIAALAAMPAEERSALILSVVSTAVATALHFDDPSAVDPKAELVSLGLDSLMAMEVKGSLEKSFRLALPASLAFDYPSVRQLTEFVSGQLPGGAS
jgi:acyl transferase domain-containing protein/acyl carrier protein